MAAAIAPDVANAILDAYCSGSDYAGNAEVWVQLHVGNPGVDGTSNPAGETTRQQAFFAGAAAGEAPTSGDLDWVSVSDTETYSYISLWDASTSGTFLGSDSLATPRPVVAGDDFTILTGDIVVSQSPIAS